MENEPSEIFERLQQTSSRSHCADRVRDALICWAEANVETQAVVAFGSCARRDGIMSADLDLAFLSADPAASAESLKLKLESVFPRALIFTEETPRKLFIRLPLDEGEEGAAASSVVKIDAYFVSHLDQVKKYVRGSHLSRGMFENGTILLYESEQANKEASRWLDALLPPSGGEGGAVQEGVTGELTEAELARHVSREARVFVQAFETASHKRHESDKFQYLFQLFIAHFALVKLEYIRLGGNRFLYCPKQVFPFFPIEVRRVFEDALEPRGNLGQAQQLLERYLERFCKTMTGVMKEEGAILSVTSRALLRKEFDLEKIRLILTDVMERDRYYNFRDAAVGRMMRRKQIYRCGMHPGMGQLVEGKKIRTVVDLRTDAETSKRVDLDPSVLSLHVDLFGCGSNRNDTNALPDLASVPLVPLESGEGEESSAVGKKPLKYVRPCEWFLSGNGRASLGLALRTVALTEGPLLLHCAAGKDRTGIVVALLQLVGGAGWDDVVRDYMKSRQGVTSEEFLSGVLGEGGGARELDLFLRSCGLSPGEILKLEARVRCSVRQNPTPTDVREGGGGVEESVENSRRCSESGVGGGDRGVSKFLWRVEEGRPGSECRQFRPCELELCKQLLLQGRGREQRRPLAILVVGLPASGKSSAVENDGLMWKLLGVNREEVVNLDMDFIRSFHAQAQAERCRLVQKEEEEGGEGEGGADFVVKSDLVGWLHDAVKDLEERVYADPEGIVQTVLRERRHFVLPAVMKSDGRSLAFLRDCVTLYGYTPCLVGIHVSEETAAARAEKRAAQTGVCIPNELIKGRGEDVKAGFEEVAKFVRGRGPVVLFDNDSDTAVTDREEMDHSKKTPGRFPVSFEMREVFRSMPNWGNAPWSETKTLVENQLASPLAEEYGLGPSQTLSKEENEGGEERKRRFEKGREGSQQAKEKEEEEDEQQQHEKEKEKTAKNPLEAGGFGASPASQRFFCSNGAKVQEQPEPIQQQEQQKYREDGFVALRGCLDAEVIGRMGENFEASIDEFAHDNGLTRDDYLSMINKWPHWNRRVSDVMWGVAEMIKERVAEAVGADVSIPVGAVMFRKSSNDREASNIETHPHSDIAYARFKGSQLFRFTTWVPLVLQNGDTLAFAKGSHRQGIGRVDDFLTPEPHSVSESEPPPVPKCESIVPVSLGDLLLFDARTYHKSTPIPSVGQPSLRLAIGIQWLTEGGLDGLPPGQYHRWPDADVPAFVDVKELQERGVFGMDTVGFFFKKALRKVSLKMRGGGTETSNEGLTESTLQMVENLLFDFAEEKGAAARVLKEHGCEKEDVIEVLKRYVLFRKAATKHYGEVQGPKLWGSLYKNFIRPLLPELQEAAIANKRKRRPPSAKSENF